MGCTGSKAPPSPPPTGENQVTSPGVTANSASSTHSSSPSSPPPPPPRPEKRLANSKLSTESNDETEGNNGEGVKSTNDSTLTEATSTPSVPPQRKRASMNVAESISVPQSTEKLNTAANTPSLDDENTNTIEKTLKLVGSADGVPPPEKSLEPIISVNASQSQASPLTISTFEYEKQQKEEEKDHKEANLLRFKIEVLSHMLAISEKEKETSLKRLEALQYYVVGRGLITGEPSEGVQLDKVSTAEDVINAIDLRGACERLRCDFSNSKDKIIQSLTSYGGGKLPPIMSTHEFCRFLSSTTQNITKADTQALSLRFSDGDYVCIGDFLDFFTCPLAIRQERLLSNFHKPTNVSPPVSIIHSSSNSPATVTKSSNAILSKDASPSITNAKSTDTGVTPEKSQTKSASPIVPALEAVDSNDTDKTKSPSKDASTESSSSSTNTSTSTITPATASTHADTTTSNTTPTPTPISIPTETSTSNSPTPSPAPSPAPKPTPSSSSTSTSTSTNAPIPVTKTADIHVSPAKKDASPSSPTSPASPTSPTVSSKIESSPIATPTSTASLSPLVKSVASPIGASGSPNHDGSVILVESFDGNNISTSTTPAQSPTHSQPQISHNKVSNEKNTHLDNKIETILEDFE